MSLESSSIKLAIAMTGAADASLSKDVSDIIKRHSLYGAICMIVPLWGLETLIYIPILWGMYVKLCNKAEVPFWKNFFTSIIGGFIVNIIVVTILNILLDFIPLAGWIGAGIIGYVGTMLSGCAYLETLAKLHQKGKVKERFHTNAAINFVKDNFCSENKRTENVNSNQL